MRTKLWVILLGLLLLAGSGAAWARVQASKITPQNVDTEPVQRGDLRVTVEAEGSLRARQSAWLIWKTSGTVENVYVSVGERVSAGQLLASLQQQSLPQGIILAQAELINAQRALDDLLQSDTQRAQAMKAVEDARIALEEARDPQSARAKALQELSQAQADLDLAQRRLEILTRPASPQVLEQARANLRLAQKALEITLKQYDYFQRQANKDPRNYMFWESRALYSRILQALELKRLQVQKAYDQQVEKYNRLTSPPNPNDMAVAQAAVESAQARLAQAQRQWERLKDGPNPAEVAVLEAQLNDALRRWERLKNGYDPADVAAAQARVQAAQAALQMPRLSAPFNGVVTLVNVQPGDVVQPGDLAFRLDDTSTLLVDLLVSEVDINRIRLGQAVILSFDGVPEREYHGVVTHIPQVGQEVGGVTNFKVTAEIQDPDAKVRPAMSVSATFVISELKDVLLIPSRALRFKDGHYVVSVLRQGKITTVDVVLGATTPQYSQVLEGDLQPGEPVVLSSGE